MATLLLVSRSAAASAYTDDSFWRSCSLQCQRLLATSPLPDVAAFLEASVACAFRDDELLYNIGDSALQRSDELDADTLGALLRVHAALRFRNDRLLASLQELLYEQMQQSRTTASGLASALLSLARLHEQGLLAEPPRSEIIGAAGRMVLEHLSFFSVSQLCDVVEAFSLLGLRGDRQISALLLGIGAVFAREAASLSASRCAAIVHSFAKLRVHDERLLNAIAARFRSKEVRGALSPKEIGDTLYGFAKFSCQDTALLDLLSIEARRNLHTMEVPLVSTVLASLAKAGVSSLVLTSRASSRIKNLSQDEIDSATKEELSTLAMAFAKLQSRDEKLFDIFAESFLRRTSPPFHHGPLDDIIHISHSFTKVHVVHRQLFAAMASTLVDRFDELRLRDVVKYLHGIAKVEYLPPPPLQEQVLALLHSEKPSELGVFDLLKLATATKRLGIRVPSLETRITSVLPNESRDDAGFPLGPGQATPGRPGRPKRRKSARKRKWTW